MRYCAASAWDLVMKSAWADSSSLGGGPVRVVTGSPTARKKFSCPGGEQMHSSRAGWPEVLVKACGALAGTLTVSPALAISCSPRKVQLDLAVEDGEHFLEVVAVRRGTAAGGYVHVDEGVPAGALLAGQQDCVGVTDDSQVRKRLVPVWPGDGKMPLRVVGRDVRVLRRSLAVVHCAAPSLTWPAGRPAMRTARCGLRPQLMSRMLKVGVRSDWMRAARHEVGVLGSAGGGDPAQVDDGLVRPSEVCQQRKRPWPWRPRRRLRRRRCSAGGWRLGHDRHRGGVHGLHDLRCREASWSFSPRLEFG